MTENYQDKKMRLVRDNLISAQHAIEAMVVQGDEETIFDYRKDNPELYKIYMEINSLIVKCFKLSDS